MSDSDDDNEWFLQLQDLVAGTALPVNIRGFDQWLSTWAPLSDAIKSRRTDLLVTLEHLCDSTGMKEGLLRATLWHVQDRYANITILLLNKVDLGTVRPDNARHLEIGFGKVDFVTFLISYDEVDENRTSRKRKNRDEDATPPPQKALC
jgi:hypothetical protein